MEITKVQVNKVKNEESRVKAMCNITFDNSFVVSDIKVIGSQKGLFIAMPSRKAPNGEFKDICFPITKEYREYMNQAIMNEYEKLEQPQDSFIPSDYDSDSLPF
jgi:stage V sporulation protein G